MKRSEAVPLKTGVLIIGSLLWDAERGRPAWREARLDMGSVRAVTAPIRYGRLSGKGRGHTYTIVFSRSAGIGHAVAVRCRHDVSTPAELVVEAEALWKAEQPGAASGRIADYWGCVALLCNPERVIPGEILKAWGDRVGREPGYGNVTQTEAEGRLIDQNGLLQIDWPRLVEGGASLSLDLLLVTANDPEIGDTRPNYPDANQVAGAWNAAANRFAEYFWKNTDNGIRTFEDDQIRVLLRPREQTHLS
jgi:hypothetical protein